MQISLSHRARHMIGGGVAAMALLFGSQACLADTKARVDRSYPTPAPVYPDGAQYLGEQGDVVLDVLVSARGRPYKIRVSQSSGYRDLDDAATEAAANWRFVPATSGGDTVQDWTSVKIHFELPQAAMMTPVSAQAPGTPPAQH